MTLQPVTDDIVAEMSHDGFTMRVKLKSGDTTDYPGVTPEHFAKLLTSDHISGHVRSIHNNPSQFPRKVVAE